jgi:hypothetical protein
MNEDEDKDFQVCNCIAKSHDHEPERCEEPPTIRGGVCSHCRYYEANRG